MGKKLIEKYAYRRLQQKATALERHVKLPHPESIRKVAVLWQPQQKEAYQFLHEHFSHALIIFRNICVYAQNPAVEAGNNTITPKDTNWLGFPKKGIVEDFLNTEFDLLLNIALEQNLLLDYLTALSKARFKVGWSPKENNFYDLNINIKGKQDAMYLASQQILYIRQLNNIKLI
ncbi:MAG: hypothetical protein K0B11_07780 [Mariniphaga sp.]|nr:hypothetical protein [Mariniphaga sp.]